MSILSRIPRPLKYRLAKSAPTQVVQFVRYPRESLFVKGWCGFDSAGSSVFFFTTHKCASMLMSQVLATINKKALGLAHLDLEAYLWDIDIDGQVPVHKLLSSRRLEYLRDNGILYAPLRRYVDLSHLKTSRQCLMLRDPRDVLVSDYYSALYSHRPPVNSQRRAAFLARKRELSEITLDHYAISSAPAFEDRYREYRKYISRDHAVTYEQMWWNIDGFLCDLARIIGFDLTIELQEQLRGIVKFPSDGQEHISSHARKGVPGDHREKLKPETISQLNEIFSESLHWLYGGER